MTVVFIVDLFINKRQFWIIDNKSPKFHKSNSNQYCIKIK